MAACSGAFCILDHRGRAGVDRQHVSQGQIHHHAQRATVEAVVTVGRRQGPAWRWLGWPTYRRPATQPVTSGSPFHFLLKTSVRGPELALRHSGTPAFMGCIFSHFKCSSQCFLVHSQIHATTTSL